ncbi:VCBS repeat-containing protein [Flavihumibacter sp. UBA7668]|uniref:VCBS repeat-containing protein n=1 Tax=Flavihumibacter sp. UBA7668 TaxID=1946542 RepID=UPI0025BAF5EE|nr:VCBS repeat-containing protein [Flavihumibacter sp. UBA7668]
MKYTLLILVFLSACGNRDTLLFTKLDADETGILFSNYLKESETANVLQYSYFYNGGGVAVGDINNDGLVDVLFTGNMVSNKLYLNKTDTSLNNPAIRFEDITSGSGIAAAQGWCTGAVMVDINNDGLLDIYICRSADIQAQKRTNLLYINEGNLKFSEQAEKYGLADNGYSSQAAFFDFDRDGDLDMFLVNHSLQEYANEGLENPAIRKKKQPEFSSKLYRNDNGVFSDISEEAGIYTNVLSFGLGIAIADFNKDGWPDLYVSNDFNEPDYYFINNADGTFSEKLSASMDEISLYSMGSDAADYNNDGLVDLITLDMLQDDAPAQKMHTGAENFDKYQLLHKAGLYYQTSRNMLHTNNGDGTFSETGQFAGLSATDWSWASLFCDFDNDGFKDLLITNGYAKDYTDMDFIKYSMNRVARQRAGESDEPALDYISKMPSIIKENYLFKNKGDLSFQKVNEIWGLQEKTISSGAAYADLDNDGDMDLVISNINGVSSVYRNNLSENKTAAAGFIKVKLKGSAGNQFGIGARIAVFCEDEIFYQEQQPVRGFQSSVDPVLHFGIGEHAIADSVLIEWPDRKKQLFSNVKSGTWLKVDNAQAIGLVNETVQDKRTASFHQIFKMDSSYSLFHRENSYNDFSTQPLMPAYLSRPGPVMLAMDINADGLDDLFVGGAAGISSSILVQQKNGEFKAINQPDLWADSIYEDVDALFFDADNDGDPDLYICRNAYENLAGTEVHDQLYFNDGKGRFFKKDGSVLLPASSCVASYDFDQDGDIDLFIGGGVQPGNYPLSTDSYLLRNDGKGNFTDCTNAMNPQLRKVGLVTDAAWADLTNDGKKDLLIVGNWMPVKLFENNGKKLIDISAEKIGFPSAGWWNCLMAEDLDKDGDLDLVIGNRGLNTQFRVNLSEPFTLHYGDYDKNGSVDPILSYYVEGVSYPAATRDDLMEQLPILKKKFLHYKEYSTATIKELLTEQQIRGSGLLKAVTMQTIYLENRGDSLISHPLPVQVQFAPVFSISAIDYNQDGIKDLVFAGNDSWSRIKYGRYRSNHGVLLKGVGKGKFDYIDQSTSGFRVRGNTRSLLPLRIKELNYLVFGLNDARAAFYRY